MIVTSAIGSARRGSRKAGAASARSSRPSSGARVTTSVAIRSASVRPRARPVRGSGSDPHERGDQQPMKVAVAGKGGSGKTTVAGTLARLLGRRGHAVLAIDADTNPNLGVTLGLARDVAGTVQPVPRDVMQERVDASGQTIRTLQVSHEAVVARYGVPAADNTTLLLMGRVAHGGAG